MKSKKQSKEHTIPWAEHEFCLVNGYKCVYDPIQRTHEDIYMRLPGRKEPITVEQLRKKGYNVIITRMAKKEWTA